MSSNLQRRQNVDQITTTQEQAELARFPVELVVLVGNGTVNAGERIRGFKNCVLGLWHTNRGNFLPGHVAYADSNPCG